MKKRLLIVISACLVTTACRAGVIRHDVDDSLYLQLAAEPRYASVGKVGVSGARASGNLVSDRWVLTAAHVVEDITDWVEFTIDSRTYQGDEWYVHPQWSGDVAQADDVGIFRLDTPIGDIEAARLYLSDDEVDRIATVVGYGQTGDGQTGATLPFGTKRAGKNLIGGLGGVAGYPDQVILADMDYPDPQAEGKAISLDLEYLAAPGDSGGGWFVQIDGETQLAGITSFAFAWDQEIDFDYGDLMAATRLGQYLRWIDDFIDIPGFFVHHPGDVNDDNAADTADLSVMLQNFDTYRQGWGFGDIVDDDFVDTADLASLLQNLGNVYTGGETAGLGVSASGSQVPEPVTIAMLGMGVLALIRLRRSGR